MMLLHLDFESFYSSADDYTLTKVSMVEYIRDARFKAFGAGIAFDDKPVVWITAENLDSIFLHIDWTQVDLVGHNVKFDGAILNWRYGYTPRSYIDTKGMSRAVLGKSIKNHSLATLSEYFQLVSKGKLKTDGCDHSNRDCDHEDEGSDYICLKSFNEKELAEYCIHDVELERQILHRLEKDFPANQYASLDQTIRMFVEPRLQLNVPLLQETATKEAERRKNIFTEIGIEKSEFASNVKFPKLLEKEGFDVPYKASPKRIDEKGNPLMIPALALGDVEFIELMESENERLQILCEARVAAKSTLLETRSTKLASIGSTGTWPFDVEFSGADQTHRFSGGSGAGGNPQNFTRGSKLREAVEAPEGYELVVGDFSNIELRLVAYLSRDPGLLEAIETGKDIYCDFASAFFGRTITKEDKKDRQFGKTAILGLGYGMGWKKFIKTVRTQTGEKIDAETSKKAVNLYRTRYGYVQALWNTLNNMIPYLVEKGTTAYMALPVKFAFERVELPSGLPVRFPHLRQELDKDERNQEWVYDVWVKGRLEKRKLYGGKLLENISQGLAGEICKDAMNRLGDNVVGQVHDELHLICRKGMGATLAAHMKRVMSLSPSWMPDMILDAEVKVGPNWGEAK